MLKTTLSLATSVTVVVLSATLVRTQQPDTSGGNDTPGTEGCVYTANCTFTEGLCSGWTNVEGSDNLDWVNNTECQFKNGRQCFSVQFKNKPPNSTAMLHSPLLCANGENSSSLSFRYAIAGPAGAMNCPLSVLLMTNTNTSLLRTLHGPQALVFQQVTVDILVSSCPFRIVFEGRKIGGGMCGVTHDEINIADVVFKGVVPVTLPTCTSTTSNTQEPTSSLGVGEAAGIGVGAIVIIALVIVVVVLLKRRQCGENTTDTEGQESIVTIGADRNVGTNHAYTPDGSLPGNTSSSRATPTEGEYDNTMSTADALRTTPTTVGLESTSTPLNYEPLARTSPQDTNYTTLSTRGTPQSVPAPDTYEPLMTRVEPTDYTALATMGTNQSTAAPENYEPLTIRHSTTGD